jgi:DNA invertase Pin-like site-specific DNA recombinase
VGRYSNQILPDAAELNRRVEEGESMAAIAREYGVTRAAVSFAIRKAGYDPMAAKYPPVDVEKAIADYQKGMSLEHAAKEQGTTKSRLLYALRDVELERRPHGWASGRNRRTDEDEFVKRYAEGIPVTLIAADLRTNPAIVRRVLLRNGVYEPTRERKRVSEEQHQQILTRYRKGQPKIAIARELDLSSSTISRIIAMHSDNKATKQ